MLIVLKARWYLLSVATMGIVSVIDIRLRNFCLYFTKKNKKNIKAPGCRSITSIHVFPVSHFTRISRTSHEDKTKDDLYDRSARCLYTLNCLRFIVFLYTVCCCNCRCGNVDKIISNFHCVRSVDSLRTGHKVDHTASSSKILLYCIVLQWPLVKPKAFENFRGVNTIFSRITVPRTSSHVNKRS